LLNHFYNCVSYFLVSHANKNEEVLLNYSKLAKQYFTKNAQCHIDNTPLFECSAKKIEQVYYHRWKMYKAHILNAGDNSFIFEKVNTSAIGVNFKPAKKVVNIEDRMLLTQGFLDIFPQKPFTKCIRQGFTCI
jgi:hypothetical protein